jgi:hypothetical protein
MIYIVFSEEESGLGSWPEPERQADDGKGGQWRSVAISRVRILLVNMLFAFRSKSNYRVDIGAQLAALLRPRFIASFHLSQGSLQMDKRRWAIGGARKAQGASGPAGRIREAGGSAEK